MERFWSKVDKSPGHGPNGECWVWTAAKTKPWGYGKFSMGHANWIQAHRHSWEMANGPIPEGSWVLHKCDNPSCVRPDHLYAGDKFYNARDMYARRRNYHVNKPERLPTGIRSGRFTMPERTANHALTEGLVQEIRALYAQGTSAYRIARLYKISESHARAVVNGKAWKHVA